MAGDTPMKRILIFPVPHITKCDKKGVSTGGV